MVCHHHQPVAGDGRRAQGVPSLLITSYVWTQQAYLRCSPAYDHVYAIISSPLLGMGPTEMLTVMCMVCHPHQPVAGYGRRAQGCPSFWPPTEPGRQLPEAGQGGRAASHRTGETLRLGGAWVGRSVGRWVDWLPRQPSHRWVGSLGGLIG